MLFFRNIFKALRSEIHDIVFFSIYFCLYDFILGQDEFFFLVNIKFPQSLDNFHYLIYERIRFPITLCEREWV